VRSPDAGPLLQGLQGDAGFERTSFPVTVIGRAARIGDVILPLPPSVARHEIADGTEAIPAVRPEFLTLEWGTVP